MKNFIKYLSFLLGFFLIISLIQFNFNYIYSTNNQQTDYLKKQIEICCTWGNKLADGILTYEINNAKPETKELVISAISYWKENIPGIEFKQTDSEQQVDIKISFRNDNGKVAGQTMTNFDSDGFIFNVKILLAEKAFGKQLNKNVIEYIAKHEFGHALGLGHANFNESLMSSLVYNSFNKISDCERESVKEANKWKLIDNDSSPKITKIKKYFC
ncbi:MAG: matrixin family metalloprotease [Nitrososphaeraceae archaeon]|nr:matrixin family metalloprotease [Nitrososphaeraceae archaeon]